MIAYLDGTVMKLEENSLLLLLGGVGLRVFVPNGVLERTKSGTKIQLHTHLYQREDIINLFGFDTEEEREFFVLLLGVNGVGPRAAMSILSSLTLEKIKAAVNQDQPDIFARVPGIGKKTAQKIVIHLQGKFEIDESYSSTLSDIDTELLDALTTLGYSVIEAQTAMQSLPDDIPEDLESKLRAVLRYFSV